MTAIKASLWVKGTKDELVTISTSAAFFTLTYFFLRRSVFPKFSASFNNRMASLVHAFIMLPVSACVLDFQRPWQDIGTRTTDAQAWCLSISFGYFVYDCIGVYLIEPTHWENTFHHLASMLAFYIGIFRRTSGSELAWSLFLMEISNPLLHLRSFMKETGRSGTAAAEVVNGLFALSFLGCRLIAAPLLVWNVLKTPSSSKFVKIGGVGVQLVSILWAWQIVKIAIYKLKGGSPATECSPKRSCEGSQKGT